MNTLDKITEELLNMNPFYEEVVTPEIIELIKNKEKMYALFRKNFTAKEIESIIALQDTLTQFLGKEQNFLHMLIQMIVALEHDIDKTSVVNNASFLIGYAAYSATEIWYLKPGKSKQRIKRGRVVHENIAKKGFYSP